MSHASLLSILADTILVVHVLFAGLVVFGLLAIYIGYFFKCRWTRHRRFRILHLIAIGIVVVQSWVGVICPLTTGEMLLREKAGAAVYSGSFIQYWLHKLLFWQAPEWVFIILYTSFAGLVLLSWYWIRPNPRSS